MELITVWGSPGSGKTTLSLEIAKLFAKQTQKNCLVIFTDDLTSPLNYLFPSLEDKGGSLGKIIATAGFYQDELIKSLVYHPDYKYLCFLGYRKNETRYNYPEISEMQVLDLFVSLGQMVEYVIVDCKTDFSVEPITQYALNEGKCIQVGGGDLKSISYFQNMHYLTKAYDGIRERNCKVVNNLWDFDVWRAVAEQYGDVDFFFPFCMEIQEHYLEEKSLLSLNDSKYNREFISELSGLIDYLSNEPLNKQKYLQKDKNKGSFFRKKKVIEVDDE